MLHAVDAGSIDAMCTGMRVAPRWRAERIGHITDIEAFVPGEEPALDDDGAGPDGEPVTMMEYNASITYRIPVTPNVERAEQASEEGRFLGLRCPVCSRTYTGGRGYCPIDAIELTSEHEVDLPQRGTVTNYTIITPMQYPGQTETEPFARVHVLARRHRRRARRTSRSSTLPNDDVRIGMRVTAVWDVRAREKADPWRNAEGGLVGWMPTGEPDVHRPRPREQDLADGAERTSTTSRSSAGASRRWCATPTRPRPRCSSR